VNGQRPPLPPACAALEPLLDRLMARDRGERFADAAAVLTALNDAIALMTPSAIQVDRAVAMQ